MFNNSYRITTAFGIPVKVHISLLILFPLLVFFFTGNNSAFNSYIGMNPYLFSALIIVGLFTSVVLHELGHSLVGIKCGYEINEIVLLPIGGVAKIARMTANYRHELLVAVAGPVVSLILAGVFYTSSRLLAQTSSNALFFYFLYLSVINLALALFNLIPSFPMDGGRILRAALTPKLGALEATRRAAKIGRTLAVIFGVYSLFWGSLWNMLIAIFIYRAAGAEYRMMQMRENYRARFQWGGMEGCQPPVNPPEIPSNEVRVGPPPYARKTDEGG
jgi:Zn-dependent protease